MQKLQNSGMIDRALLHQINKLVNENSSLKQQVLQQQKIIKDIELHNISKGVAKHIDKWMDQDYSPNKTKQQDIEEFAFQLTKYINHKLRN
ncbi:hypothetical protein [Pseudogracilibacillus auburnensis]|uniref:hypothetical protein n=1 Tax=Pseudogracilibacillus auburnensis TaxID=1494959 RepID=UPI001A975D71|nr:hypothetical protein [Pseudogracilibacillus auburnensis]MBO1003145.1 hypothetical protein [Pseudogracilibacillus auburnensis]